MDRRNTQETAAASSSSGKQPPKATKEDVHTAMTDIIANEDYRNKLIRTSNLIALLKYEWRKSGRELSIDKRACNLAVGSKSRVSYVNSSLKLLYILCHCATMHVIKQRHW